MGKIDRFSEPISEIFTLTKDLISEYGPRIPGSEACLGAAERIEREFKKVCDGTRLHAYSQHPGSFFNITRVIAAAYILGSISFLLQGNFYYVSSAIYSLGMIYFIHQFVFFGTLFDRLFPRRPGCNVVGTLEPKGEARQQIIVSAHHDSSYICNFLERNQKYYALRLIVPFLFLAYATGASWIASVRKWTDSPRFALHPVLFAIICLGLLFVIPLFRYYAREGSPGAGDNLLSSIMCIKIAESVGQARGRLKQTRLILLSLDGEEIGQKGSRAFIEQNREELRRTKTYAFNIDSIYRREDLAFVRSERNGTIPLSKRLLKTATRISEELDYSIKKKTIPIGGGGTDAGQFAKAGIETVSLIGISTAIIRKGIHYHTSTDTVENIEPEAVGIAMNLAVRFILEMDDRAA